MIVTLTTDFGASEYVAAMKGVLLTLNPTVRIVDVRHDIVPGNVAEGAFVLYAVAPQFPGAIHVGVVDPGVGTSRRGLAVFCEGAAFVGPDNGLLMPAARRMGLKEVRELANPALWRQPVHPTFHGRDVFAPVAAQLSLGSKPVDPEDLGPVVSDPVDLDFGTPEATKDGFRADVIYVDRFGNAVTNVPAADAEARWSYGATIRLQVGGREYAVPFLRTFGLAARGALLIMVGSHGFLEIAANGGNASHLAGLRAWDRVSLRAS